MKKGLRIISLLAVLLLIFSMSVMAGAEEEDLIAVTVDTVEAASGEETAVTIHVSNAAGMDSIQFRVNYDSAVLSLVGDPTGGEALQEGIYYSNVETKGVVDFAYASAEGLKDAECDLLTLTFTVNGDTGSAVTLSDILASKVDSAYTQTKAYVSLTDGGVAGADGTVPAALTTPWPVETPTPTPTPTPAPTPEPTPTEVPIAAEQTELTPAPAATAAAVQTSGSIGILAYWPLMAAAALIILIIVLIVVWSVKSSREKKRKKAAAARRRAERAAKAKKSSVDGEEKEESKASYRPQGGISKEKKDPDKEDKN